MPSINPENWAIQWRDCGGNIHTIAGLRKAAAYYHKRQKNRAGLRGIRVFQEGF